MRLFTVLPVAVALLSVAFAHAEGEHGDGHHHEPHHWESKEMHHELLTQLGGIAVLGVAAGGYLLIRRRGNV